MDSIRRCARCILPVSLPSVDLDESGVCAHCRAYDLLAAELERTKEQRERKLQQIVDKAKEAKKPYDCVVPLSGGKDSTYVLYLCNKLHGLRCICATLENGYLTQAARANIENALQATGADHVVYRVNRDTMLALYGLSMRNCGMFCPPCNRGIEVTMRAIAKAFDVPLVVTGHGEVPTYLSDGRMPEVYRGGEVDFFREAIRGSEVAGREAPFLSHGYATTLNRLSSGVARFLPDGLPRQAWRYIRAGVSTLLRRTGLRKSPELQTIGLYDYVDVSEQEIKDTLTAQMGWRSPDGTFEHLDCAVAEIKVYVQMVKYPELTRTTIRHSGLVRAGRMPREEALAAEAEQFSQPRPPAMLDQFLADLAMSREEFETFARR